MKVVEASSRGRGGGGYRGGRGGRRGGGGRGRGGGGRRQEDARFASRFTDPRFKLSSQKGTKRNPREELHRAAREDPRFAKKIVNEELEYEENSGEESSEGASETSSQLYYKEGEEEEPITMEEEELLDDDVNAWEAEDVEYIEAKKRIAIVNCDWDHIRATDLYALLFHALPLGGRLLDVCVYKSELGKKMIEHERVYGPNLWSKPGEEEAETGEEGEEADGQGKRATPAPFTSVEELPEELSDDEVSEPRSDGWVDDNPDMFNEQGDDGEFFSEETAAAVYNELDGMDIEASGVVLDLRYIDDDETFDDPPVSRADCIPPNFRPLSSFKAAALTQTKFRISWDQEDVFRHQSVQDAFTGTTAEDDLAAYLAPADSDEDNPNELQKSEERLKIRRKYSALLSEIGGLPDQPLEDGNSDDEAKEEDEEEDNSGSDDDSLNRFSDLELDSEQDGPSDGDGEDEDGMQEMEATLDMDASQKAIQLQKETRLKQKMKESNLASQAEIKYKQRRKEMKKTKKEMHIREREEEIEKVKSEKEQQRHKLKEIMGEDGEVQKLSSKERRKLHAKQVKAKVQEERNAKKKMRIASELGVQQIVGKKKEIKDANEAMEKIDPRFSSKLLSDPRFNLDVGSKDKRVAEDVANLAKTVNQARRVKRTRPEEETSATSGSPSKETSKKGGKGSADVLDSIDYFLDPNANQKKKKK